MARVGSLYVRFSHSNPCADDEPHLQKWYLCDKYLPYALGGGYILGNDLVAYVAANANRLERYNSEVCCSSRFMSFDNEDSMYVGRRMSLSALGWLRSKQLESTTFDSIRNGRFFSVYIVFVGLLVLIHADAGLADAH
jgi:hypothetical protein